jgi:hypothetical protein
MPRPPRLLAFLAALAAPSAAVGHLDVYRAELFAVELDGSWRMVMSVEGSEDVAVAVVTPPGGAARQLFCQTLGFELVECVRVDPAPPAAGFVSLAALLASFPAGDYTVATTGPRSGTVPFSPLEPDGTVTVVAPAPGAVVGPTPAVSYQQDCSGCDALIFEIDGTGATAGVRLEAVLTAPLAASGSLAYDDFAPLEGQIEPPELPEGGYELAATAVTGVQGVATFSPGFDFVDYASGARRDSAIVDFTVPEPDERALAAAASLALLASTQRKLTLGVRPRLSTSGGAS